jgi:hypothetical protein
MDKKTFQIKYQGKTLTVRRQGRDETIGAKSLQVFDENEMTDKELKHCGGFKPSTCVGDPIAMFDKLRTYVEVVSVFYPGESTDEFSEARKKSA